MEEVVKVVPIVGVVEGAGTREEEEREARGVVVQRIEMMEVKIPRKTGENQTEKVSKMRLKMLYLKDSNKRCKNRVRTAYQWSRKMFVI